MFSQDADLVIPPLFEPTDSQGLYCTWLYGEASGATKLDDLIYDGNCELTLFSNAKVRVGTDATKGEQQSLRHDIRKVLDHPWCHAILCIVYSLHKEQQLKQPRNLRPLSLQSTEADANACSVRFSRVFRGFCGLMARSDPAAAAAYCDELVGSLANDLFYRLGKQMYAWHRAETETAACLNVEWGWVVNEGMGLHVRTTRGKPEYAFIPIMTSVIAATDPRDTSFPFVPRLPPSLLFPELYKTMM